jgi:hypothetical protein
MKTFLDILNESSDDNASMHALAAKHGWKEDNLSQGSSLKSYSHPKFPNDGLMIEHSGKELAGKKNSWVHSKSYAKDDEHSIFNAGHTSKSFSNHMDSYHSRYPQGNKTHLIDHPTHVVKDPDYHLGFRRTKTFGEPFDDMYQAG